MLFEAKQEVIDSVNFGSVGKFFILQRPGCSAAAPLRNPHKTLGCSYILDHKKTHGVAITVIKVSTVRYLVLFSHVSTHSLFLALPIHP